WKKGCFFCINFKSCQSQAKKWLFMCQSLTGLTNYASYLPKMWSSNSSGLPPRYILVEHINGKDIQIDS
ncbi:hypothetical protein VP01_915g11, partial [Puccinia sorghi]